MTTLHSCHRTWLACALLAISASLAATQNHRGDLVFVEPADGRFYSASYLFRVDPAGTVRTWFAIPVGQNRAGARSYGACMDADNRGYVATYGDCGIGPPTNCPGGVLFMDPSGLIRATVAGLGFVQDVVLEPNGEYAVLQQRDALDPVSRLFRVNALGAVTTLVAGSPLDLPTALIHDDATGNYIVADRAALLAISPDGRQITTLTTLPTGVARQVTRHLGTGDYFIAHETAGLLRYRPGGSVTTLLSTKTTAVVADRASAAMPRIAFSGTALGYLDLRTSAVTTLGNYGPSRATHVFRHADRNVVTTRPTAGYWSVQLDFPGERSNGCVLALSISGLGGGTPLADGRSIPIRTDAITALSLQGALGGILQVHGARLDRQGQGWARLDLRRFRHLAGLRVWIQVLTLDPWAPLGIATIADPVVVVL